MGRKLYAKGEGFNPTTSIEDVEGLREELDALKGGSGGGGGDNAAIERRLSEAEGEIDDLQGDVAEQSEKIAAVGAKVNTLQGTDSGKSVRTIAAEETAKIVGNAPANYDTLKEIADYIATDAIGAAELSNKANKNATDIAKLAVDLNETHQLASNAESAISEVVELTIPAIESEVANKATKSEAQGYATTAKNEAIAAAATDAQNKANTAESNANNYTDGAVDDLAKGQVATNKANIATHTQQIANLDSDKLGKAEKAADSAKADSAPELSVKTATVTSVTNAALTYHLVLAANAGSLPYGDNANALISIPTLAGNLKYLHQLGFTGKGLFYRKFYNKDVDAATPWSQIAFTDSTVANADNSKYILTQQQTNDSFYASASKAYIKWITSKIASLKFTDGDYLFQADLATKLATPRTIWGQSFDGTGDINGNAKISGQLSTDSYIVSTGAIIGGGDNVCQISNNAATVEMRVTAAGSARLMRWKDGAGKVIIESDGINTTLRTGNVGIGTTSPTEKLDVAGNIKAIGNVSAKGLQIDGDVVITGNVVIEGSVTSGASYQSNPLATISEDEVPSVEQQLRAQISSLEERIATLEQLIAQNNG